jgi:proteasome assembly chaperone (PAC2) family protein
VDGEAPALIAAFEGWNDAANAASDALRFLLRALDASEVHELDAQSYFDFQAARPQVEIVNGVVRDLRWPATKLYRARLGRRDVVLALGVEPNLHWPAFCSEILDHARALDRAVVVTLGALLGDTPHTRPIVVTGTASDPRTASRLHLQRSRYEGPTGIVGVLADAARQAGLMSVSLWAPVPHYVASPPNPKATLALLERLAALLGTELDLRNLALAAHAWEQQVDSVARDDEQLMEYVRSLELRHDAGGSDIDIAVDEPSDEITFDDDVDEWDDDAWDGDDEWADDEDADEDDDEGEHRTETSGDEDAFDEDDLPSGDALAAEFERYLRRQRDEGDTGAAGGDR